MKVRAQLAALALCALAVASSAAAKPRIECPPGKPPDWAQMPNAGDFSDFSSQLGTDVPPGKVNLSCVAGADGRLYDCQVADEAPANQGLGLWALHVSRDFRLKRPGCPANGVRFEIPLHFERAGER